MAKKVLVSADNIVFALLPGSTGEFSKQGQSVSDTVLGETYKSSITGAITWSITSNSIYKGFVGFQAKLLRPGTPVTIAGASTSLVAGKTYQITNTAQRVMDRSAVVAVFDGVTNVTSSVESIDYLFGMVTFVSTFTPVGTITLDYDYLPLQTLGKYTSYTLTQTSEAIKTSDSPTLATNGGFDTHIPGLKTVTMALPAIFSVADGWGTILAARDELIIEINPDGLGGNGSVGRGFFRLISDSQSGDVGALEEETLNFELSVPFASTGPSIARPFGWVHGTNSPIPAAIKILLSAWETDTTAFARYLHDGVNGWGGEVVVTDVTLTGGNDAPNTFAASFTGSGAFVAIP